MTCPECNEELQTIGCVVRATQYFDIESATYGDIVDIEETLSYYCPLCGADLDFGPTDEFICDREDEVYNEGGGH